MLTKAGMTSADAARMVVGAPATRVVDWNGTRIAAPMSTATTLRSGGFMTVPTVYRGSKNKQSIGGGFSNVNYDPSVSSSRTSQWVSSQNSMRSTLEPFHPGALRTTWVTPPGSTSTSTISTVSTAPLIHITKSLTPVCE